MSTLRKRNQNNDKNNDHTLPNTNRPILSTDKIKTDSGLIYNYEDRLNYKRLAKTGLLMVVFSAMCGYIIYELFKFVNNLIYDFGFSHGTINHLQNTMDLLSIFIKSIICFYIFKYLNKTFLLVYPDEDELNIYN